MKIFQTPSYDRFCLFEMERKSKDFRGMDDNVAYKNKQIDNVEISNEGRRALREKLREVKPKVEEPIGYELTISLSESCIQIHACVQIFFALSPSFSNFSICDNVSLSAFPDTVS